MKRKYIIHWEQKEHATSIVYANNAEEARKLAEEGKDDEDFERESDVCSSIPDWEIYDVDEDCDEFLYCDRCHEELDENNICITCKEEENEKNKKTDNRVE